MNTRVFVHRDYILGCAEAEVHCTKWNHHEECLVTRLAIMSLLVTSANIASIPVTFQQHAW